MPGALQQDTGVLAAELQHDRDMSRLESETLPCRQPNHDGMRLTSSWFTLPKSAPVMPPGGKPAGPGHHPSSTALLHGTVPATGRYGTLTASCPRPVRLH